MSDEWLGTLATALGTDPLEPDQTSKLLAAARDVAHRVERRVTPLALYVLGRAAERLVAAGATPDDAIAEALTTLEAHIPDVAPDAGS